MKAACDLYVLLPKVKKGPGVLGPGNDPDPDGQPRGLKSTP